MRLAGWFLALIFIPFFIDVYFFSKELTSEARELRGELYCLPCHDKQGIPICGACRRPIEERVVRAMGKHWYDFRNQFEKDKC